MNTSKIFRPILVAVIAVALIFSLSACNKKEKPKKTSRVSAAEQKERAFEAYKAVLTENATKIKAYAWQTVSGQSTYGNQGIQRQVALLDLDGDKIPELFFMAAENENMASLHIYGFDGKEAIEFSYGGFEQNSTNQKFTDAQVAAGYSYVLYKGKEPNTFYLYYSIGDEGFSFTVNKYVIKNFKIELSETLVNRINVNYETGRREIDEYTRNGNPIEASAGSKAFTKTFSQIDKAIIFSTDRKEEDISLWKRFNASDALCVSYDDAMNELSK